MVVMLVIAALVLAASLMVGMVSISAARRAAAEATAWRRQAECLAESGLQRAAAQLRRQKDYRGETWRIGGEEMNSSSPAVVTIEVQLVPDQPDGRQVLVRADYPDDPHQRARCEKRVMMGI